MKELRSEYVRSMNHLAARDLDNEILDLVAKNDAVQDAVVVRLLALVSVASSQRTSRLPSRIGSPTSEGLNLEGVKAAALTEEAESENKFVNSDVGAQPTGISVSSSEPVKLSGVFSVPPAPASVTVSSSAPVSAVLSSTTVSVAQTMPALTSTATVSRAAPLRSNLRPLASPFQPVSSTQNVASSSSWYQGPVQQTPSLSTIVYGQPQPPVSTVPLLGQVPYMNATSQSGVSSGDDILKQLRKVSIPVFDGNKRNFPSWRAAFMACIDKSSVAPEVKLLHLRQYLKGEALASIESLGFTASAYQAALARLG